MIKYVEWVEPFETDNFFPVIMKLKVKDAVSIQRQWVGKSHPDFVYKDDQEALDDFVSTRWGKIVEE